MRRHRKWPPRGGHFERASSLRLPQGGELVADLVDQVLGARGLLLDRLADALLDLVRFLQGRLRALALASLALDPVAGLPRLAWSPCGGRWCRDARCASGSGGARVR